MVGPFKQGHHASGDIDTSGDGASGRAGLCMIHRHLFRAGVFSLQHSRFFGNEIMARSPLQAIL